MHFQGISDIIAKHMQRYRSGYNGPDSKTRVPIGRPPSKKRDFSKDSGYAAEVFLGEFSPRILSFFRAIIGVRNSQLNKQRYRRGHNENDSKSFGRLVTGPWVRIPPAAPTLHYEKGQKVPDVSAMKKSLDLPL